MAHPSFGFKFFAILYISVLYYEED